jgi:hypothetical protein
VSTATRPVVDSLDDIDFPLSCAASRTCLRPPLWHGSPPCGCDVPMCDPHKVERETLARRHPMRCRQHGEHQPPVEIKWRWM